MITVRAPRSQHGSTKTPLAWMSDAACSIASSLRAGIRFSSTLRQIAAYDACVCCAAFSVPVVPDVNSVSTTSLGRTSTSGSSLDAPAAAVVSAISPGGPGSSGIACSSGTDSASAIARSRWSAPYNSTRTRASTSMRVCSSSESRALSGTRFKFALTQAKSTGTLSRLLFSSNPTRARGGTPRDSSVLAKRELSSSTSPNVIVRVPAVSAMRSRWPCAPRTIRSR